MLKRIRNTDEAQSGFTLIELLIVIVILGILAAIVVFAVGGINDRGTNAACKSDVKTIETAQEAYYAQNKVYAGSASDLLSANLIREVPSSSDYTIATGSTGAVTVTTPSGGTSCPS